MRILIDNGQINQGDSLYLGGPKTLRGYKSYAFPQMNQVIKQDPYTKCGQIQQKWVFH